MFLFFVCSRVDEIYKKKHDIMMSEQLIIVTDRDQQDDSSDAFRVATAFVSVQHYQRAAGAARDVDAGHRCALCRTVMDD